MSHCRLSVIVPVYNASRVVAAGLKAIISQNVTFPYEVIVVDDGSTDDTSGIVRAFPQVRYIFQNNAGPAAARNRGADLARGEWLVFTDADCCPRPEWLLRLEAEFHRANIVAVAGSYGIANPESRLARGIHAEIVWRHRRLLPDFPRCFGSYNVAVRRDVFQMLGGFDTRYRHASGEDNDLSYRINGMKDDNGNLCVPPQGRIYFCRRALVDHRHPESLIRYLREQFRHGFWRVHLYRHHRHMLGGDDYTFWKDMAEPVLCCLAAAFLIAVPVWPASFPAAVIALLALAVLETAFGLAMLRRVADGLFFAGVMTLRAAARTAGFVCGLVSRRKQFPPPEENKFS